MDRGVHFTLTRKWAAEEGFTQGEADEIALANEALDRTHHGRPKFWYRSYHFVWAGAGIRSWFFLRAAMRTGDLVALGRALHCLQDVIGHGMAKHTPALDRWDERDDATRTRLERESREMMRRFRRSRRPS